MIEMLREVVYADLIARDRTEAVAKEWGAIAAGFEEVCGAKDSYTRADIILYLGHLRKRKLTQTTIDKNLKVIKLVAKIQGTWEFPKLDMRRPRDEDIRRTIFSLNDIVSMISLGKLVLSDVEKAYLALSTIYGLRRIEMVTLKPQSIKLDGENSITVHVAKEGPQTTHVIPPEIAPYLGGFKPYRPDTATHMFHRIGTKTGFRFERGYGWHSIRRSLTTELILSEASALNVARFMRWSEKTVRREFGMLPLYAKKDQPRIDNEIFRLHPFLPYWGLDEVRREKRERAAKLQQAMMEAIDLLESGYLEEEEIEQLIEMIRRKKGANK